MLSLPRSFFQAWSNLVHNPLVSLLAVAFAGGPADDMLMRLTP